MRAALPRAREHRGETQGGGAAERGCHPWVQLTREARDAQHAKLAVAAYKKGVAAFNKYIEIGNDGLGLNFQPLDTID